MRKSLLIVSSISLILLAMAIAFPGDNGQSLLAQSTGDTIPLDTATPTPTRQPATPTPAATAVAPEATVWQARLIEVVPQVTLGGGAIVRVYVQDRPDEQIEIRHGDVVLSGVAGSKVEFGPYAAEFAPIPTGKWVISVPALGVDLTIQSDDRSLFVVEFRAISASQATAEAVALVTSTPIGGRQWEGRVVSVSEGPSMAGALLRVKVEGLSGLPVDIATFTDFIGQGVTGSKPEDLKADEVEFAGLAPGSYIITPHSIHTSLTVELAVNTTTLVEFKQVIPPTATPTSTPRPPTATPTSTPTPAKRWTASMSQNSNRAVPTDQMASTITVQVERRRGQNVALTNSRGERSVCKSNTAYLCQFNELKACVYTVALAYLGSQYSLYVDGAGQATITFTEEIVKESAPIATAIIGRGAVPNKGQWGTGFVTATPTTTQPPTPSPTAPPTPTRKATSTPVTATATATSTPPPTSTSTPVMAWIGTVAQNFEHPGQTIIVRAPLGNHPVILRSGGWQVEGLTGTKPEHGEGAVEFAGLAPGTYTIELVGLGETSVSLEPERFMLVQFNYGPAPTPTPTPQPGQWTGAVLSNTSGSEPGGGAWSILTIEVGGWDNLKVVVSSEGTQLECITGTKPELGPGVCEIGGLWPAVYHIQPQGLPVSLDIELDGRGVARVAFWQQ